MLAQYNTMFNHFASFTKILFYPPIPWMGNLLIIHVTCSIDFIQANLASPSTNHISLELFTTKHNQLFDPYHDYVTENTMFIIIDISPFKFHNMVFNRNILLFFFSFFFSFQYLLTISAQLQLHHLHHSLHTDKLALLNFKKSLDPNSNLSNWNESTFVCNFTGVKCKNSHRVSKLLLSDVGLQGRLPPILSNLTALRIIDLTYNRLFGIIPREISALHHLRVLLLDGNNLNSPVPDSFSLLPNLSFLSLSNNSFAGPIPSSLFSNCTSLANLDLSQNMFIGNIPAEIGNCPNLWNLNLYNNQFTGHIPLSLTNASTMYSLDVEYNLLSGDLPSELVSKLPELHYLHFSYTHMVSHDGNNNLAPFFSALGNCSCLKELELAGLGLGGSLPGSIGKLGTKLKTILLQENNIYGSVPPSFANLSTLITLNLTSNFLNETISSEISKLPRLEQLFLAYNNFTGEIPATLGQSLHLGLLDLSNNRFSGKIPESFGNLVQIRFLFLNNNLLSGEIPPSLGKCKDLSSLDLSYNRLTGSIPPQISGLRNMGIFLNLSHNQLEGTLPLELSKLANVLEIDLSENNLSGSIFVQISSCIALEMINLSRNSFQGWLPESLGDLRNLKAFDVSKNKLSGKIPTGLNEIRTLNFLNLSENSFEGPIPFGGVFSSATNLSFLKNPRLCGSILGIPACSSRKKRYFHSPVFLVIFCIVISVSVLVSILCYVIGWRYLRAILISTTRSQPERKSAPDVMQNFPRITYKELSEATGGFDDQRLIGSGGYGRVYKGILSDGTTIAVKVLQLQTGNSTKSFNRECQVLKRIRHRNLIRIITACSLPDFKALVLPFMSNGSLDSCLYPHPREGLGSRSSDLNIIQRVNICSDIAEGMAYLHHHSPVRVIHCDLKPSNVLLKDDMTALVSDFGISRLVMTVEGGNSGSVEKNTGNSMTNMLSGSIGYIAPEYGVGSSTSTKGDVYSFGILVLETVTRKRPTDDIFVGGLSLPRWVKKHYHGRIEKVVDSSLVRRMRDQSPDVKRMWEVAIGELFELGILCTQDTPSTRPTMLDAADDLDRLKRYLTGDTTATFASSLGISSSTLGDD